MVELCWILEKIDPCESNICGTASGPLEALMNSTLSRTNIVTIDRLRDSYLIHDKMNALTESSGEMDLDKGSSITFMERK